MLQKKVVNTHPLQTLAYHFLAHVLWTSRRKIVHLSVFINLPYTQFVPVNLVAHLLLIICRFTSNIG